VALATGPNDKKEWNTHGTNVIITLAFMEDIGLSSEFLYHTKSGVNFHSKATYMWSASTEIWKLTSCRLVLVCYWFG